MIKNNQKYGFQCFSSVFQQIWVLVLLILLSSHSIFAAGILDPNFGSGGKVSFRIGVSTNDRARAAALQPDGKIVIVGTTLPSSAQSPSQRDFAVARLNTDGSLDSTFGNGGRVITDFNNEEDIVGSVVIQSDGKIVVGGGRRVIFQSNSLAFALARYNPNGSLDQTFGSGGKVVTDIPFPEGVIESISFLLLQTDGKIIAVGSLGGTSPAPGSQILLVRYNTDGSLDASFGDNGKFKILFGYHTSLHGAAIQPDGKILISGAYSFTRPNCIPTHSNPCTGYQMFLLRYDQQMRLDRRFGRRFGKEFYYNWNPSNGVYGLSVQPDGRIFLEENYYNGIYSSSGRLQGSFDQLNFANQDFPVSYLRQRPDGTIAGCGYLNTGGSTDMAVALFNGNGRFIGADTRDFFGATDVCTGLLAQPDNKIVIVGNAQVAPESSYGFAVMRYLDITP